jgi:nucleolar protein 14
MQYQNFSKRYVPEVINYALNALRILAPAAPNVAPTNLPNQGLAPSLRLQGAVAGDVRLLRFWDILPQDLSTDEQSRLKAALIEAHVALVNSAAELWAGKPAFYEVFEPPLKVLQLLLRKECEKSLPSSTRVSPGREYINTPKQPLTSNSKKPSRPLKGSNAS